MGLFTKESVMDRGDLENIALVEEDPWLLGARLDIADSIYTLLEQTHNSIEDLVKASGIEISRLFSLMAADGDISLPEIARIAKFLNARVVLLPNTEGVCDG